MRLLTKATQSLFNEARSRGVAGLPPMTLADVQCHLKTLLAQEDGVDTAKLFSGKILTLGDQSTKADSVSLRLEALEKAAKINNNNNTSKKKSAKMSQEICRRFNSAQGCEDDDCTRRHACSFKVDGVTCGKHHPKQDHV